MALAVAATLFGAGSGNLFLTLVMIAFGAVAGYYVANRVQMTEMPKLVAALHSFVGLAAVFMGINAEIALADVLAARASGATEAFTGFAAVLAHKTPAEIAMLRSRCSSASSSVRSPSPARSSLSASWPARSTASPRNIPAAMR